MTGFTEIVTQSIFGLSMGLIYCLATVGLSIVLGFRNVVNLAQGAFFMIGAYVLFYFGNFWLALVGAFLILGVVGIVFQKGLIDRFDKFEVAPPLLATFGVAIIIRQIFTDSAGALPKQVAPPSILQGSVSFFGITLPIYYLAAGLIGAVSIVILFYVFYKTDVGIRAIASTHDEDMAQALGVDVNRINLFVFGFGLAFAGLAGAVSAPIFQVEPQMGLSVLPILFLVAILGGLGNIKGTLIAGIVIGEAYALVPLLLTYVQAEVVILSAVVVFLMVRPRGIAGIQGVD